jgi:hypothetical protein
VLLLFESVAGCVVFDGLGRKWEWWIVSSTMVDI